MLNRTATGTLFRLMLISYYISLHSGQGEFLAKTKNDGTLCVMPEEKESRPISVRLTPDILARLNRISERSGLSRSSVIKVLVNSFLERVGDEAISGHALQAWEEAIMNLDGRTRRLRVAEDPEGYRPSSRRRKKK